MDQLTREPEIVTAPRRGRRRGVALLVLLVTIAAGVGIWYWPVSPPEKKVAGRWSADGPVPVSVAPVETKDVPVWLDGLGTVQAFQTVTVRSMVDGPLVDVPFKEGQDVHAGEVLARIDPRTFQAALDGAVAKKALDEATLANARLDLARYQKLVSTNFATQQQADTAKATVAQLEAQTRQDQAQIDSAATQLSWTTIVSPLDGTVGMRLVDKGNIVHPSDSNGLLMVTQLRPISVLFSLPQQALGPVAAAMKGGAPVEVVARADRGGGELDRGTLTVLDNQIDQTTGTIKLKATFPNSNGRLWPGGFVAIRLRVDTLRGAIAVPPGAVQRGPDRVFVYVVEDNVAHRVDVTVGHEDDTGSVVTQGVAPGQSVVIDGASRVRDGGKVIAATAGAAPRAPGIRRPSAPGTAGAR